MKAKLAFCLVAFLAIPLLLGGIGYAWLCCQSEDSWRKLMPAADFCRPQRGLRLLVLSWATARGPWYQLYESHYYYPDGERVWLVLKENAIPGGDPEPYAVDQDQ